MNYLLKQIYSQKLDENEQFIESIQNTINLTQNYFEKDFETESFSESETSERSDNEQNEPKKGSQELGEQGELQVLDLLQQVFVDDEILRKNKSKGCGDIQVHQEKMVFLVEVKNKQTITKEDLIKFDRDIQNLKEDTSKMVIGLFISLNTYQIPNKIGSFNFKNGSFYVTKRFMNVESFFMIKQFSKRLTKEDGIENKIDRNLEFQNILLTQHQYQSEFEIMNSYIKQLSELKEKEQSLMKKIETQSSLIQKLIQVNESQLEKNQFMGDQRQELVELLKKKKRISKQELLTRFPKLNLDGYTMEQIRKTFI